MRTALTISLLLALPGAAHAADHLMKVGEIQLVSGAGSTTSQFVELEDPLNESFPNAPYSIEVFNADGASTGSQTITVPSGTTRLLIATAAAAAEHGVTPNATLTVTLPGNGQLCFKNSAARIHCLRWGTIITVVGPSSETGPVPGNTQSLQRGSSGYCVATPTPGAANVCPAVGDAGPSPDAGNIPDAGVPHGDGGDVIGDAGTTATPPGDDDEGCNAGGGASWFALAALATLMLVRRRTHA